MQSPDEVFQPRDRRPWTEEEDEMLRMAIEEEDPDSNPPTRWHAISQHIPNRTNKDCRKRWWAQMATIVSKGSWTSDEDERLCRAVDELGPKWALVANRVRTRNSGQCAKRWNDALNPAIDRSGWTREEDEQLLRAVEQQGHSWANIARTSLPGRTGLAAKNRYNHLMRGACRQAGRRRSRTSPVTTEKRRTRGTSDASVFHHAPPPRWAASQPSSDGSDAGTTPSTPRSFADADEVHLYTAAHAAADFGDAEMLSGLAGRLPSPLAPPPVSSVERQFMDLFSPHLFAGDAEGSASGLLAYHHPPSPSAPYLTETPPLLGDLGESAQLDPFAMWSPCISGPATPIDTPFLDLALGVSQHHATTLYHPHALSPPRTAPDAHSDAVLTPGDYLALYPPPAGGAHHEPSPYLTQSIPELSSVALDAQVTISALAAFPDKASVQLAQQATDPADRRVAVAVAICDQQDVISTVHSLSHSLSSMLGQGQGQTQDAEDGTTPKTYSDPHSPQLQPGLWPSS